MRKVVLTYGLIAGGILSAMMLLTIPFQDAIGFDRSALLGYAGMVCAFFMVYVGIQTYRDSVGGGRVTFRRALAVGASITAIASVCYTATWQVVYYRITPDFGEKYAAYSIEKARASGATEAELAVTRAEMEQFATMYQNPLVNIALTLLEPLPVGLLFSLVSAGVLSRRPRTEPAVAGG